MEKILAEFSNEYMSVRILKCDGELVVSYNSGNRMDAGYPPLEYHYRTLSEAVEQFREVMEATMEEVMEEQTT